VIQGAHTQPNVQRDFVEWHRGRSPYVVWVLDVDLAPVRQRIEAARQHLEGILLPGYQRQPHLTLDLCGFPADYPTDDEEFSLAWLAEQYAALRRLVLPPFELQIEGLDSFDSAPYLSVRDQGEIAAIRAALAVNGQNRLDFDFVPHVTVGLYGRQVPAVTVNRHLANFVAGPPIRVEINAICLMAYEPADIGGRLQWLGEYRLA
jgi:2'-5' RNA ligase